MKIDRMLGILTILLQKERVTAPELAKKFEVSRRTIGRDIDALCIAGIPIITYQGSGGGISIAEGFKIDKSVLTTNELSDIVTALKGLGSITTRSNIERTLDKLYINDAAVMSLREPIIIDLASHYKGELTEKIEQIKQAVLAEQLIEFDYFYDKGESHRRIEPYFIIFQWTSWYVFGYCLERSDFRLFKLNRLWNLHLLDENYTPREIPTEKRNFNRHFETKTMKLVALFDVSVRYQVIENYGMDYCRETKEGFLLEVEFSNHEYMLSWLLSFGSKVKVLEPYEIAQEIKHIAEEISAGYK